MSFPVLMLIQRWLLKHRHRWRLKQVSVVFTLLGDAAGRSLQVEAGDYRVKLPLIPVDLAVPRCELQRVYQAHGQAVCRHGDDPAAQSSGS